MLGMLPIRLNRAWALSVWARAWAVSKVMQICAVKANKLGMPSPQLDKAKAGVAPANSVDSAKVSRESRTTKTKGSG